jgi:hypothetical protein
MEQGEEIHRLRTQLTTFVGKVLNQSECLEKYAEMAGFEARPVPSVFHFQASHFRDFANEAASAIEARRAETQSGSVADESAVPKADAQ